MQIKYKKFMLKGTLIFFKHVGLLLETIFWNNSGEWNNVFNNKFFFSFRDYDYG